ncbi:hypothetical protein HAX54_035962 [Datura stramonium]|uniref:Uncharacterized protein n=1 Tax=Datura stramonium TaxID=4076 RepID=A0ABS8SFV2_DATST|nr:hypothetical protein [Datura stramonium]
MVEKIPGSKILISILVALLVYVSGAQRAEAARPTDCWTGTPNEKLHYITENQLDRIADERDALDEKVVGMALFAAENSVRSLVFGGVGRSFRSSGLSLFFFHEPLSF